MFFTLVKKIERQIPHKYREKQRKSGFISHFLCLGGEKGIRTLDTVPRIHDFQSCALDQTQPSLHTGRTNVALAIVPDNDTTTQNKLQALF